VGFQEHQRALRAVCTVTLRRRPWFRAFRLTFPIILVAVAFGPRWFSEGMELNTIFLVSALPWLFLVFLWIIFLRWGESYLATRPHPPIRSLSSGNTHANVHTGRVSY